MLARELLRDDPERVRRGFTNRRADAAPLERWLALDAERRVALVEAEELKRQKNEASRAIGQLKQKGADAVAEIAAVAQLKEKIETLEKRLEGIDPDLEALELTFPNLPHESVPVGDGAQPLRAEVGEPVLLL
jgi:seryl-tRNA synthetase